MRLSHRQGTNLRLVGSDSGTLNTFQEDCLVELPESHKMPTGMYCFMPIGEATVTIVCHGGDRIEGQKQVTISGQEIHTVISLGDRYVTDFNDRTVDET